MKTIAWFVSLALLGVLGGCATQKESFTARTGTEQLLLSGAIDRSLDRLDFHALARKQVFLETKYLECVDKNYVIVSLHHHLLKVGAKMVDKADAADVIIEVASGAVGTDGQEMFIGIPEIPLPPPSPVAIPRLGVVTRTRMNGTAKLQVIAYDAKTKMPLINSDPVLARTNQNNWNVLGAGPVQTGSVPDEIALSSDEMDLNLQSAYALTKRVALSIAGSTPPASAPPTAVIQSVGYDTKTPDR